MSKQRRKGNYQTMDRAANLVDRVLQFEKFEALMYDFEHMTAEDLYKKYAKHAAIRTIIELRNENPTAALTAAREILDRSQGRATERKEISHRLKNVPEKEVDSLILSSLEELKMVEAGSSEDGSEP